MAKLAYWGAFGAKKRISKKNPKIAIFLRRTSARARVEVDLGNRNPDQAEIA